MAYGVLISNNVGSRKSVPVFDSRKSYNSMPQSLLTITTTAGVSGNQTLPAIPGAKTPKEFSLGVYPTNPEGDMPDVHITNGRVHWNYYSSVNPTAVRIAVFT